MLRFQLVSFLIVIFFSSTEKLHSDMSASQNQVNIQDAVSGVTLLVHKNTLEILEFS